MQRVLFFSRHFRRSSQSARFVVTPEVNRIFITVVCLKIPRVGRPACLDQQTGPGYCESLTQKPAGQVLELVGRLSGIVGLYL